MATKTAPRTTAPPAVAVAARPRSGACHHHWLIEPPNGPRSRGNCKHCGLRRWFPNSSEDSVWDSAEGRSRWNDMGLSKRPRRPLEEPVVEENVVAL